MLPQISSVSGSTHSFSSTTPAFMGRSPSLLGKTSVTSRASLLPRVRQSKTGPMFGHASHRVFSPLLAGTGTRTKSPLVMGAKLISSMDEFDDSRSGLKIGPVNVGPYFFEMRAGRKEPESEALSDLGQEALVEGTEIIEYESPIRMTTNCVRCPDPNAQGGRGEKKTSIIATLGPKTVETDMLVDMFCSGVNMIRINGAHATPEFIQTAMENTMDASKKACKPIAKIFDSKGPEIRSGQIQQLSESGDIVTDQKLNLVEGDLVDFIIADGSPIKDGVPTVKVIYDKLVDLDRGKMVSIDGEIETTVEDKFHDRVRCRVQVGGEFGEKRHVNLPGTYVDLPSLTDRDRYNIRESVKHGVDFIAHSFVRNADDVNSVRAYLDELSDEGIGSGVKIISKIEDLSGINNLEEIIDVSDGIMVARGDLGVEANLADLPSLQHDIVNLCHRKGVPMIIATEMLESMTNNRKPTRAEVSDVGRSVRDDMADVVMLSGETAKGDFPLETVRMMSSIAKRTEDTIELNARPNVELTSNKEILISQMVDLAANLQGPSSLIVFSRDGLSAQVLSSKRPMDTPIYAFTDNEQVARQMQINWGVQPFVLASDEDITDNEAVEAAKGYLEKRGFVESGENLVMLIKTEVKGEMLDSIRVEIAEDPLAKRLNCTDNGFDKV